MLEQPTEAFIGQDIAVPNCSVAIDPFVAEALVRTLGMIVSDEVGNSSAQRVLADEDESVQALGFDRLHKSLGERIHVGRLVARDDRRHARILQCRLELRRELAVAIDDQVACRRGTRPRSR